VPPSLLTAIIKRKNARAWAAHQFNIDMQQNSRKKTKKKAHLDSQTRGGGLHVNVNVDGGRKQKNKNESPPGLANTRGWAARRQKGKNKINIQVDKPTYICSSTIL
jgi:hypothetical protein